MLNLKENILVSFPYTDMCWEAFENVAELFLEAHTKASCRPSLEIGTRRGGSTYLMLRLLDLFYGLPTPFLISVDPYGEKPYKGGDGETPKGAIGPYGYSDYIIAKGLLAGFAHHAHYYMTSDQFFEKGPFTYWQACVEREANRFAFALLDGDHDADTIVRELSSVVPMMHAGGIVLVDNIEKDPRALPAALEFCPRGEVLSGPTMGSAQLVVRIP